jgi:hypothetical protein
LFEINQYYLLNHLLQVNALREQYIWPSYTVAIVFINNPGNLSDYRRLIRLNELVAEFEALPESLGPESTKLWLRDYQTFIKFSVDNNAFEDYDNENNVNMIENSTLTVKPFESELQEFLRWPEYQHWSGFIRYDDTGGGNSSIR